MISIRFSYQVEILDKDIIYNIDQITVKWRNSCTLGFTQDPAEKLVDVI